MDKKNNNLIISWITVFILSLLIIIQNETFAEEYLDYYNQMISRIEKLTEEDYCTTMYLKKNAIEIPHNDYFETLKDLRHLLKDEEWISNITGFYIGYDRISRSSEHSMPKEYNVLKLVCFNPPTPKDKKEELYKQQIGGLIGRLIDKYKLINIGPQGPSKLPAKGLEGSIILSTPYGGEELRFRKFLSISTLIALDIIENDLLAAQRLFSRFPLPGRRNIASYKLHFPQMFETSHFYNLLSTEKEEERDRFWEDIKYREQGKTDWMHMPMNMICGEVFYIGRDRLNRPVSIPRYELLK